MQKIIYFTAGTTPTEEELADINALNALAAAQYDVNVSNGSVPSGLGDDAIEASDFVAGTIPDAYEAVDIFDINNPPEPSNLPATQAVVSDEDVLRLDDVDYEFTVEGNDISAIAVTLPSTQAIVSDEQEIVIGEDTFTITVAGGVITAIDVT